MRFLLFFATLLLYFACSPNATTDALMEEDGTKVVRYWVNSAKVDCEGEGPQTCYQIQRGDTLRDDGWELFYDEIEGFKFEPGQLFHLRVEEKKLDAKMVPAGGSSMKYTMVEFISRTPDIRMKLHNIYALESINGKAISIPQGIERPSLEVNVSENRVMGTDGCNRFQGSATIGIGGNIAFGPLAGTKKMCRSMETSKAYMNAMAEVKEYALRNGKLFLSDANGKILLRFRPVD